MNVFCGGVPRRKVSCGDCGMDWASVVQRDNAMGKIAERSPKFLTEAVEDARVFYSRSLKTDSFKRRRGVKRHATKHQTNTVGNNNRLQNPRDIEASLTFT